MHAVAKALTDLGVLPQRKQGAVDVDGGVVLDRPAVGLCNLVVGLALPLHHLQGLGQEVGPLAVGQGAQCGSTGLPRMRKACGQVHAGGVHPHQLGTQDRVQQRGAGPLSGLPAAGQVVGE